ncbi:alpha/beta fold hydrolase [Cupriavidus sp. CuC1]|uniref:alpha/beta fold hydrolase n=1 Tax=Cupriavidus sp. CuC1 TaxID=3373131 RepID=UPI0037D4AFDE
MQKNLVLVPGLNNTRVVFARTVAALPPSVCGIAVDCPALPSVEAIADALLPALPERFWLGGFSFGGYVALALLESVPERIEGIALICTASYADSPEQGEKRRKAMATAREGGYFDMIEAQAANAFHPRNLQDADLMSERRAMVRAYGVERYLAHMQAVIDRPDRSRLFDGSKPTLAVGGSHDRVFPEAMMRQVALDIPGAVLRIIAPAGHLVPMEQPRELASALAHWMGVGSS